MVALGEGAVSYEQGTPVTGDRESGRALRPSRTTGIWAILKLASWWAVQI